MEPRHDTPWERVKMSLSGVIPAAVGIPIVMGSWAPMSVVIAWTLAYLGVSGLAWACLLMGSESVEDWWSATLALVYTTLPITAYIYDPGTTSFWLAAFILLVAIAFEVSTLPYLGEFEWRTGPVIKGAAVVVIGYFEIGFVVLALVPVLLAILRNGSAVRASKEHLQESYASAESESERAQAIARNDVLTGLLNRRGLIDEIERLAATGPYTLLMVDADGFKTINDTHGHGAGDEVLRGIAETLAQRLGPSWTLGRHGGDEFVAVTPGTATAPDGLCMPVQCNMSLYGVDTLVSVGLSGGLALSGETPDSGRLLSQASYAMRIAKARDGGLILFDDELSERFDRMLEVVGATNLDADVSPFVAYFQPIVETDGTVSGCETLCRWRRPDGSMLSPDQFLPLLAESGQTGRLNTTMLRQGLAFAARFNDLNHPPYVSVNIGAGHLNNDGFVALITSLLTEFRVEPHRLMIEITENETLDKETGWRRSAQRLLDLGIRLAIDDFGSGYSNIDRLNQLPISHLKFDRSLTTSVSGPLGSVVEGLVDFAAKSDLGIIAEGIETEAELRAMCHVGVSYFQGFYFARPAEADTIERLIRDGVEPRTPAWLDAVEAREPSSETGHLGAEQETLAR